MHIDAVELVHLKLPLAKPRATALGEVTSIETVVARLASGELSGWGEVAPGAAPTGGEEWAGGVYACLCRWLAPALVGQSIESGDELTERLAPVRGNRHGKAALDLAWWDLVARDRQQPLREVLAAPERPIRLAVALDLPIADGEPSIDRLIEQVGRSFEMGYAHVTLWLRPGWDLEVIRAVRQMFPTEPIRVDCDGHYGSAQMEMFYRFGDFALEAIEQPLDADDLVAHAMLAEQIHTPVWLDQSITSPSRLEQAIDLGAAAGVNLRPDQCGGLTAALSMHEACVTADLACSMSIGPRSAIGQGAALALAAKDNYQPAAELYSPETLLAEDFAPPPNVHRDAEGVLSVSSSDLPGIGFEPDVAMLRRLSVAREVIR